MTDSFLDAVGLDPIRRILDTKRSGLVGNFPIISCMGLGQSEGRFRPH